MAIINFLPVGRAISPEVTIDLSLSEFQPLVIYAILLAVVAFLNVFMHGQRRLQSGVSWLLTIGTVVFQFLLIMQVNNYASELNAVRYDGGISPGTFFPLLAIIAFIIALRYIHGQGAEARQPIVHE